MRGSKKFSQGSNFKLFFFAFLGAGGLVDEGREDLSTTSGPWRFAGGPVKAQHLVLACQLAVL